jgi:glycosyltransferase involved in cell wall biosynthesis
MPNRVIYYFADYWPTLPDANTQHWQGNGHRFFTRLPYALLGKIAMKDLKKEPPPPELKFKKTICVSKAVRDKLIEYGLPINNSKIIYNGIRVEDFYIPGRGKRVRNFQEPLNLLYAGRLAQEKGVHLAINAVYGLIQKGYLVRLEILGQGQSSYLHFLINTISSLKIQDYVNISAYIPREKIPQVLANHDVLLVPSLWPEPLPRIIQEGMAAGLVVIGAAVGGITEAINDGVDGICFHENDVDDLISKIEQIYDNPGLYERISEAGIQKARKNFDIQRTVAGMEHIFEEIVATV